MKTLAEQISDMENARAAKAARMNAVTEKSLEEGRSLEASEIEEFDTLEDEIKQIDEDLVRYNKLLSMQSQTAKPAAESTRKDLGETKQTPRGPMIVTGPKDKADEFQGQSFTRKAIAKIIAKQEGCMPWQVADQRWGKTNPNLVEIMKTAVPGHGGSTGEAGAELVTADNRYSGDFVEFLYSQTVYNQLPLREVPANVNIKGQDGAATAYWVGESKSIPMSKADFNSVLLTYKKVAALTTISNELLRYSDPAAEMLVRDALVNAAAQRIDTTFIGNSAGVANVSPAGILFGIDPTTSAGTDTDGVLNDIKELRQRFITAKNSGGLTWVMNPGLASSLSLIRNALGQKEFTEINQNGGALEGDPVVVGHNVDANALILMKPSDIWRIGMGNISVTMSEHATIEQADDPTGASDTPVAQSNSPVNMFQSESTAVKVVMDMDFARRRESAVAWIDDADYGGAIST
jgi:hypothetical protein